MHDDIIYYCSLHSDFTPHIEIPLIECHAYKCCNGKEKGKKRRITS